MHSDQSIRKKIKSLTRRRTRYKKEKGTGKSGTRERKISKRKHETHARTHSPCSSISLSLSQLFLKFHQFFPPQNLFPSLLEDLALDVLEAVDRRLLGEHVLDALLLGRVGDVDLGPVVEVEVVALLFRIFVSFFFRVFFFSKSVSFFFLWVVARKKILPPFPPAPRFSLMAPRSPLLRAASFLIPFCGEEGAKTPQKKDVKKKKEKKKKL